LETTIPFLYVLAQLSLQSNSLVLSDCLCYGAAVAVITAVVAAVVAVGTAVVAAVVAVGTAVVAVGTVLRTPQLDWLKTILRIQPRCC